MREEASLGMGIATGVVVFSIYQHALPSVVDHRVGDAHDPDAGSAEVAARWLAAGVVAGISLIAKDPTVFVIGGSMVVALSIWHRLSNMRDPVSGVMTAPAGALGGAPMVAVDTADSSSAYAGFE